MSVQDKMWVERHRPENLDEIIGHNEVVDIFKSHVDSDNPPNILLAGRQGVGKTAMVVAFAREKYGDEWRSNTLELNASDERGIDVVREKIKDYARTGVVGQHNYKIIFLDEFDSMTKDAQSALRRVMEDYSDNTRFFLSCNYANKIIDPIISRCFVCRFGRLEDGDIETLVRRVIDREEVDIGESAIEAIVADANGDARKAVNTLQGAQINGELTTEVVEQVTAGADWDTVKEIIDMAIAGDIDKSMRKLDVEILKAGVSEQAFLDTALSVVKRASMPEDSRAKAIQTVAECDWRLGNGANPHIQLHGLLTDIMAARHASFSAYED